MKKKILHLCCADKFINPLFKINSDNLKGYDHTYWIMGSYPGLENTKFKRISRENSNAITKCLSIFKLLYNLHTHEVIICHGLFGNKLITLLYFLPWITKRAGWAVWGGDLYGSNKPPRNIYENLSSRMKKRVIRSFGYYITYLEGDIDRIRDVYQGRGRWLNCLLYTSNIVTRQGSVRNKPKEIPKQNNVLKIQLGNSADPSNQHLPIIKKLSEFFNKKFELNVPLAYGCEKYRAEILSIGESVLGTKFRPQTKFVGYDEYIRNLEKTDIAIFNFDRQQGMGNIINLINFGAHIYLKKDQSPFKYLKSIGITVSPIPDEFTASTLRPLTSHEKGVNRKIIQELHNESRLVDQLHHVCDRICKENV